jgi:hypothetical protein
MPRTCFQGLTEGKAERRTCLHGPGRGDNERRNGSAREDDRGGADWDEETTVVAQIGTKRRSW